MTNSILIVSAVFPPEPVVSAKLSNDIAIELSKKNKISVISPKPTRPLGFKFNKITDKSNFEHFIVDSYTCPKFSVIGRLRESYSFGKHCYKYICKNHLSINKIYSVTWPLLAQYYVVKAAIKFNIPVVVHVQDIYPESLTNILPIGSVFFTKILLPIDKYVLKKSSGIIAISNKMKLFLEKTRKLKDDKIAVVQNWQDEKPFNDYHQKEKETKKDSLFTFMYLGNIGPLAGIETIIDAFSMAIIPNSRLIIAGSGSMKNSLIKKSKEYTDSNIDFWDVPDGKVPEIQNFANVFLLPIKKGGASNSIPSKLPAYMFSSKAIIASVDEDSDTALSIKEADCGWVVPSENIEKLSKAMKNSASISKENLNKIGSNGHKYAMNNFSREVNLQKVITVINQVEKK